MVLYSSSSCDVTSSRVPILLISPSWLVTAHCRSLLHINVGTCVLYKSFSECLLKWNFHIKINFNNTYLNDLYHPSHPAPLLQLKRMRVAGSEGSGWMLLITGGGGGGLPLTTRWVANGRINDRFCICFCCGGNLGISQCGEIVLYKLLLLLLHSRLQTPTGRARCQKPKGPSREDSPVRKEKILDRKKKINKKKYNNDKNQATTTKSLIKVKKKKKKIL